MRLDVFSEAVLDAGWQVQVTKKLGTTTLETGPTGLTGRAGSLTLPCCRGLELWAGFFGEGLRWMFEVLRPGQIYGSGSWADDDEH